ncbi:MAG: ATP-binding protein, partial [Bdellovibrionota bacterium]
MEHCLSPVVSVSTRQNTAFVTHDLRVEVSVLKGLQNLSLTGLPSEVLRDARDKIRAVLHNCVAWDPLERLVIHISPQEIPKVGAHLELPILVACWVALQPELRSDRRILAKLLSRRFYGSVDLSGRISTTPTSRSLEDEDPLAVGARHFSDLRELFAWIVTTVPLPVPTHAPQEDIAPPPDTQVRVEGRRFERFALFVAAVLREPVLLVGPPGVGKTHLGKWCRSWYLGPARQASSEKERIWRSAGYESAPRVPFLNPHARTHVSEFLGYKKFGRSLPGLFSLAHGGLMVLDEFPELSRDVREIFRNVLDQKELRRFNGQSFANWPADFWLVATANPCACGQARPRDLSRCRCSRSSLKKYLDRFSGPLLDRFCIQLFMQERSPPDLERIFNAEAMGSIRTLID